MTKTNVTEGETGRLALLGSNAPSLLLTVNAPLENAADIMKAIHNATASVIGASKALKKDPAEREQCLGEFVASFKFHEGRFESDGQDLTRAINREISQRFNTRLVRVRCEIVAADLDGKSKHPPLFWKRWTVSMVGVYPLLIIVFFALEPLTRNLSVPVSLFLVALVLTGLNTKFVVPFLMRKAQFWLAR